MPRFSERLASQITQITYILSNHGMLLFCVRLTPVILVLPSAASAKWQAHRITWSAWKRTVGGMIRPRAWAVLRFMTHSHVVSCSPGQSSGFALHRILSASVAACGSGHLTGREDRGGAPTRLRRVSASTTGHHP